MKAEIIAVDDLTERELAAWAALGARAISPNPFAEPDFVLPAARGLRVRDVGVLVVRERDEWQLATPVRRQRLWYGVPGRCLTVWRHDYSFLGTPLVGEDRTEPALAAMMQRALAETPTFVIDLLDGDGRLAAPLAATMGASAQLVTLRDFARPMLRRGADGHPTLRMSSRHRADHRRTARRLREHLGTVDIQDSSADAAAYERFLAMEAAGWKGAAGTALACDPGHAEFFRDMCRRFARAGRLELLSLGSEEQTAAMMCNLRAGEGTFGFKMTYDESLARFEPGIQLIIGCVEHFDRTDAAWLDSCAESDNHTLARMWQDTRRVSTTVAVRAGIAAAPVRAKWSIAASARPLRVRMRARWAWARRL
ncbi:MAG TPA: GNAT family N-acetyltransferase [Solirubrobacteraceae bacterium]|nr:GNAT family N-acetyltransferase [Solirubrobacteraceae bacterium]